MRQETLNAMKSISRYAIGGMTGENVGDGTLVRAFYSIDCL